MTPERFRKLQSLLASALEQTPGDARSAFVDKACATDSKLRDELRSLLAYERTGEELLEDGLAPGAARRLLEAFKSA